MGFCENPLDKPHVGSAHFNSLGYFFCVTVMLKMTLINSNLTLNIVRDCCVQGGATHHWYFVRTHGYPHDILDPFARWVAIISCALTDPTLHSTYRCLIVYLMHAAMCCCREERSGRKLRCSQVSDISHLHQDDVAVRPVQRDAGHADDLRACAPYAWSEWLYR